MFNFNLLFKSRPKFRSGALKDDRSSEEKSKDYQHREIASSMDLKWRKKPKSEWADYPVFDQDGSGSCVAQAIAKALGIENINEEDKFVHLSPRDLYSRRPNDSEGMRSYLALEDVSKNGMTLEQQMPSQGLNEKEMNNRDDYTPSDNVLSEIFKPKDLGFVEVNGIDEIAEALERNHPVVYSVRFKRGEWNRKVPRLDRSSGNEWGYHKVTAIDYFTHNGKKAILTDDSWGPDTGYDGRRIVTEDWFEHRIYNSYYFRQLSNTRLLDKDVVEKPEYEFTEPIVHGDQSDSVAKLQEALKLEGFFPKDTVCTGYYGGLTRKAVKEFQYHYEVAPKKELETVNGMRVGPTTRSKLNELF